MTKSEIRERALFYVGAEPDQSLDALVAGVKGFDTEALRELWR